MDTTTIEVVTQTVTAGGLMQDALNILWNDASSTTDIERARNLITAARELRIAQGKRNSAYANVEAEMVSDPEPALAHPVGTHEHHLDGGTVQ